MKRRIALGVAGIVLVAAGWLALSALESEPVYQGKGLGAWLAELDKEMPASNFSGTNGPAATAIQHIGTKAIPYLRSRLAAKDSRLKTAVMAFSGRHAWLRIHLTPAEVWRRRAASGIFCLGPRGSPLMPDILGMFRSTNYAVAFTATETMGRMGYCNPETITVVLAALVEPPNGSPGFHDRATLVFLQLSQSMEIVTVDHPDAFQGIEYKAAVPALLTVMKAPDDMPLCLGATLKPCAGAILKRIDPEAAVKAGVQ